MLQFNIRICCRFNTNKTNHSCKIFQNSITTRSLCDKQSRVKIIVHINLHTSHYARVIALQEWLILLAPLFLVSFSSVSFFSWPLFVSPILPWCYCLWNWIETNIWEINASLSRTFNVCLRKSIEMLHIIMK